MSVLAQSRLDLRPGRASDAGREAATVRDPRIGSDRHLRTLLDRLIAASSLVPDEPVLDMRGFGWTCDLRRRWHAIRDEALAVVGEEGSLDPHRPGDPIGVVPARCPATAAAVAGVPGLVGACFSILAPGTHLPARRGATKGLVTCHLGLIVPQGGDVRMRIGDRMVRWAEGETLVFDDTFEHEVWNDSSGLRVVLMLRFRRPLAQPGRWIADRVIAARQTRAIP